MQLWESSPGSLLPGENARNKRWMGYREMCPEGAIAVTLGLRNALTTPQAYVRHFASVGYTVKLGHLQQFAADWDRGRVRNLREAMGLESVPKDR